MSAGSLCLYHCVDVLISLKHENFRQVTKMNMQDRHWRVRTFMGMIYPWCLQEMNLHLKCTLLCLNLFSACDFSDLELSSVVWFPQIVHFPFLNLRKQTVKNQYLGVTAANLYLKCFIFDGSWCHVLRKKAKPVCVLVWGGLLAQGQDESTRIFSEEEECRNSDWRNWLLSRVNILLNRAVLSLDFQVSLGRGRWIKCKLLFFCCSLLFLRMRGHVKLISLCMSLLTSSSEITGHQGAW